MVVVYRVQNHTSIIKKMNYVGETPCYYIQANGSREAKVCNWQRYFPTYREAKDYLVNKLMSQIKNLKDAVNYREKELSSVKERTEEDLDDSN